VSRKGLGFFQDWQPEREDKRQLRSIVIEIDQAKKEVEALQKHLAATMVSNTYLGREIKTAAKDAQALVREMGRMWKNFYDWGGGSNR
jgi:phage shock protein A